jgi:hypothetical protein
LYAKRWQSGSGMNKVAVAAESWLLVPVYLAYIEFRDKIGLGPVIVKHYRYNQGQVIFRLVG